MTGDSERNDSLSVYRRLVRDKRLAHGAFRLWHYLRDRADSNGICWPQQRTIAKEMGCKTHSLTGWIQSLVICGYLSVDERGANHHFVYRLIDRFVMPKPATRSRDAQTGYANNLVMPISARRDAHRGDARVAPMGNVSKYQEVNPISKLYSPDSRTVLHILNEASGKNFREIPANLGKISDRLKEPEVTLDGVRLMIHRQVKQWKGTQMEEYLRPETLFGKLKFDGYYAAREQQIYDNNAKSNRISNAQPPKPNHANGF